MNFAMPIAAPPPAKPDAAPSAKNDALASTASQDHGDDFDATFEEVAQDKPEQDASAEHDVDAETQDEEWVVVQPTGMSDEVYDAYLSLLENGEIALSELPEDMVMLARDLPEGFTLDPENTAQVLEGEQDTPDIAQRTDTKEQNTVLEGEILPPLTPSAPRQADPTIAPPINAKATTEVSQMVASAAQAANALPKTSNTTAPMGAASDSDVDAPVLGVTAKPATTTPQQPAPGMTAAPNKPEIAPISHASPSNDAYKVELRAAPTPQIATPDAAAVATAQVDAAAGADADLMHRIDSVSTRETQAFTAGTDRASALFQRPELPQYISRQIAQIAQANGNKPVEISLNPEELGRVRMALSSAENSITVVINVERSETLDLLRRNMTLLSQEFRDIGYGDVNFAFSGQDSQQASQQNGDPQDTPGDTEIGDLTLEDMPAISAQIQMPQTSGLDIRI